MRPILPRRFRQAAGLAAMAATVVASQPAAAMATGSAAAGSAPAGSAARSASVAAVGSRPLLLINGTRLAFRAGPGGRTMAAVLPSSQGSFAFLITSVSCGQTSEVPADALPFVGRGLDPSLFAVRALQRREHAGRLPVRVSYRGRRVPALPGVTITHAAAGTADGYLTPGSARKFGAALQRQFLADHARASYGTDGLFARGLSIALAGAPATPRPRPQFVMHTLTVKGRNLAGNPDNGDDVLVFNADNCARFGDPFETDNLFRHGVTRFSVPAGHYWAVGQFLRVAGGGFQLRLAVLPQFTVSGKTTVHVAERSASSRIAITTARPAVSQMTSFTLVRGGQAGSATSIGWSGFNTKFWVSRTSTKPTVGSLQSFTSAQLTSPAGAAGVPYAYNLDFPGPAGLIPAQHFAVRPASLATVDERYYQDVPSTGAWATFGGTAAQLAGGGLFSILPLKLPGRQIQYMSGGPAILWSSQYWEFTSRSGNLFAGQADSPRTLPAGQHQPENWNRYPLHPAPNVSLADASGFLTLPSAGRAGNTLTLDTTPFSDNELGHRGTGFFVGFFGGSDAKVSGRYEIDQNGVRLAAGNAVNGIPPVRLSGHPSVIRFALSAARIGKHYLLSPASATVWTWRSRRDTAARVPPAWLCIAESGHGFRITRRCAVQPMMTLRYQVHGLANNGSARPGRQLVGISVGHLQLASAPHITGVHAQVSFDGGVSWQPASVTRPGGGQFRAAFAAPPGAFVTLRVTATDAAGGSITETILRAYQTAS